MVLALTCFTVFALAGAESILVGLSAILIATIIASVDPLSAVVCTIGALAISAFIVDPLAVAGGLLIFLVACCFGIYVLAKRARKNAKLEKRYEGTYISKRRSDSDDLGDYER